MKVSAFRPATIRATGVEVAQEVLAETQDAVLPLGPTSRSYTTVPERTPDDFECT